MLDLRHLRQHADEARAALQRKAGEDAAQRLDRVVTHDERRRELLVEVEAMKHERNETSRAIGQMRSRGEDASESMAAMKRLAAAIKAIDEELRDIESQIQTDMEWLPNLPHEAVPDGADEAANVVVRTVGEAASLDFEPRDHVVLGQELGILDLEGASKLSGSGFAVLRGTGSRLTRALIQWMLDFHVSAHGYTEVWTPVLVREDKLFGTGQLPKLKEDMYRVADEDVYLIPTAEVTITGLLSKETVPAESLPVKLVGYTACFRREAGAAGRDTRGLLRLHQFDKVELVRIAHPEHSWTDHLELLADAESVLQSLDLHYRVVELCAGDLSFAAARCYDLEVWAPGESKWLEVSSCSNFVDFQARRLGIRMRRANGKSPLCHTLNASGVALPRLIVAILENYQTSSGTVRIPEVLRPYMGGIEEIVATKGSATPDW